MGSTLWTQQENMTRELNCIMLVNFSAPNLNSRREANAAPARLYAREATAVPLLASKGAHERKRHFVRFKTPITTGSGSTTVRSRDLHTRGPGFEPRLLLPPLMTLLH